MKHPGHFITSPEVKTYCERHTSPEAQILNHGEYLKLEHTLAILLFAWLPAFLMMVCCIQLKSIENLKM